MSYYEDFVADGSACHECGQMIDGTPPGCPRTCEDCATPASDKGGEVIDLMDALVRSLRAREDT